MYVIIVMGADRPESGLRSNRTKFTKKFLIIVMSAVRPVGGLHLKKGEIWHGPFFGSANSRSS